MGLRTPGAPGPRMRAAGTRSPAGWALTLYPQAAEGGGCFVGSRRRAATYVPRGAAGDPERARAEAERRARARLRRYCVANGLNRLGTLTYEGAGCHDPVQVRRHVGAFFRALRQERGGKPFPYAWVPEWHKTDHGLHLHFALGGYVPRHQLQSAWGRGFVHIKLLGDLAVGSGRLGESRRAAGYLSKYVAKSFTGSQPTTALPSDAAPGAVDRRQRMGLHRFDVAQGFTPVPLRLRGTSRDAVIAAGCEVMGSPPGLVWTSDEVEDWQGPPALWVRWD